MMNLRMIQETNLKFITISQHYYFNIPQSQIQMQCFSDTLHA